MRPDDDQQGRSAELQNAYSILLARQRAERNLLEAREALDARSRELAWSLAQAPAILDAINDGILVTDASGRVTHCNQHFRRMWGLSDEPPQPQESELAGLTASPAGWRGVIRRVERLRGGTHEVRDELYLDDGRIIERTSRLHYVDNQPAGRVWSFRDVTGERRLEQAARLERERFEVIVNQSPVGMIQVDSQICVQHVNPQALRVLPPVHDLIGRPLGEILELAWPADAVSGALDCFRQTLATGEPYFAKRSCEFRRDRGVQEFYDWQLHRIVLPEGGLGVVCLFVDVSEFEQAQASLTESQALWQATFNQAAVGMAIANLAGDLEQVNHRFEEILGFPAEELRNFSLLSLTYEDDVPRTRELIQLLLDGQLPEYAQEKRYVRKDGTVIWSLTTATLLKDASGRPQKLIASIRDMTARKRAEEAVRDTVGRLQFALDAGQLGDWSWDAESDRLTLGARAAQILGLDIADRPTWGSLRGLIHPDDRQAERMALQAALEQHADYCVEYRLAQANPPRWIAANGRGVYRPDGSLSGMIGVVQDITERRRAEEGLRRSEADLRTLANSIPQLAWMAHPDGHIFWFNRGWFDYTGTTLEQMAGWGWQTVHDPKTLPAVMEQWKHSLATGEAFKMEFPLRGADGSYRWFLTRANPVSDEFGRVIRWFGTNTDVDEVQRAQQALREETRMLELLNEAGTVIGSTLDLQEIIQRVTDTARQLSGAQFGAFFYNRVDSHGESFMLYTLSGAPPEAFKHFGQPRSTPLFGPTFRGERSIRSDDILKDPRYGQLGPHYGMPPGHLPVRSYLAVPVVSRTGEVIGGMFFGHAQTGVFTERIERFTVGMAAQAAMAIDNARLYERLKLVSEERSLLLEAERAARSEAERISTVKDEFLATLSHELRTPLNSILGWAQLLSSGKAEEADFQQGLDAIQRNARVQTQLIEDLLDMSRIISGKVRLRIQPVDLPAVLESAVNAVLPAAEAKRIRLRTFLSVRPGVISGDPTRLQQVVWNLLNNAIKFTPQDGEVEVCLERVDSHLQLVIRDTGIGIKPDFLPLLFERFRQVDASTTRSYAGLGLGLSIVKHLVELHGGTIRASSPGEGRGSTFEVMLPLSAVPLEDSGDQPPGAPPAAQDTGPVDLSGVSVLVVEDQPDALALIQRVLSQCKARVETAASALDGLQRIRHFKPDVLVSDIGMPEMDGYQFIREVRKLPADQGGRTPAVALTAFARSQDRTQAMMAGYQVHVAKPIEPRELLATIRSLVPC